MKHGIVAGIATMLVLGLTSVPMQAQTTVEGAVVIRSGPEPVREVIVVQRVHAPHRHGHRWWKKHGYRTVTVYYDGNRYYMRRVARPGIRAVIVYEMKGRYYVGDERNDLDSQGGHGAENHDGEHED
jgi:hypothetical protein